MTMRTRKEYMEERMGCGVAAMQDAQMNTTKERKGVWFCCNAGCNDGLC